MSSLAGSKSTPRLPPFSSDHFTLGLVLNPSTLNSKPHYCQLGLFPLGLVLNPGAAIPLHIFEMKYRNLFSKAWEGNKRVSIPHDERPQPHTSNHVACFLVQFSLAKVGTCLRMAHSLSRLMLPVASYLPSCPMLCLLFLLIPECCVLLAQFGIVMYNSEKNQWASVGTTAELARFQPLPDGKILTVSEGKQRFRVLKVTREGSALEYIKALVEYIDDVPSDGDLTLLEDEVLTHPQTQTTSDTPRLERLQPQRTRTRTPDTAYLEP
jgi:Lon protease-like protein